MAENQFPSTVDALFKGMDHFITSKTVVGEPVKVDENTTIIPLVDVTCRMGARSLPLYRIPLHSPQRQMAAAV